ncbi:MAG: hypothetical protein WA735_19070 [Candidatus Acidiferrales bacterium]
MTERKLRVKQVSEPVELVESHPSNPNRKAPDEIAPNPGHGGLRVLDHGKHELVHDHPARRETRRHPQSEQLSGLGNPRERE